MVITLGQPLYRTPHAKYFVICSASWTLAQLHLYADKIRKSLQGIGWEPEVRVDRLGSVQKRLEQARNGKKIDSVLFAIGIHGGPGDDIPENSLLLMDNLDDLRLPYRVFSDGSLDGQYPAIDQAPHLVELAGGASHRLHLGAEFSETLFLGFDLGHPRDRKFSVPVISIVSNDGELLGWWRSEQPNDETLRNSTLRRGFNWLQSWLKSLGRYPGNLVALHDGRLFERELLVDFLQATGIPFTLVEMPKRPSPYILRSLYPAPEGCLIELRNGHEAFLQPPNAFSDGRLSRSLRIRIVESTSQFSLASIARSIFGLCYAPTLGLAAVNLEAVPKL